MSSVISTRGDISIGGICGTFGRGGELSKTIFRFGAFGEDFSWVSWLIGGVGGWWRVTPFPSEGDFPQTGCEIGMVEVSYGPDWRTCRVRFFAWRRDLSVGGWLLSNFMMNENL